MSEADEHLEEGSVEVDLSSVDTNQGKKEHAPPEHSKRWKQIYGKAKQYDSLKEEADDLRAEMDQLKASGQSTQQMIDAMRDHNEKLAASIQEQTTATVEAARATTVATKVSSLEAEISDLHTKADAARAALDFDEFAKYNKLLYNKSAELEKAQKTPEAKPEPKKKEEPTQPEIAPELEQFFKDHPWAVKDPLMNLDAQKTEIQLREDPTWKSKSDAEIYAETGRLVEEMYDYNKSGKVDEPTPRGNEMQQQRLGGVENPGRSRKPSAGAKTKITLSAEEAQIARALGVSHEDYAKQLMKINSGDRRVDNLEVD